MPDTAARMTAFSKWVNRWWPSTRLGSDPLATLRVDERYVPVSIANWKLTPSMRSRLLALRVAQSLTFELGRRLTVVIPFRDRDEHLRQLIPELRRQLEQQHICHQILVVDQQVPGLFNRGRLLNIGMQYASSFSDYFCLHDVDAVPVNANYACPSQPLRLVNAVIRGNGRSLREPHYFSGAVSILKEHAWEANGFSNEYWGWGKEDDDFFFRLLLAQHLCFYDSEGVFLDLPNPQQPDLKQEDVHVRRVAANRKRRSQLVRGLSEPDTDGLASLKYEVGDEIHCDGYRVLRVRW